MARILLDSQWLESLNSSALYEVEFERIVRQKSSLLFPGFYCVPFKKTVFSEEDAARPDYALVEVEYREWWVVEMELAHHSLEGHVLPQVTTLSRARYGQEEATYLAEQAEALDRLWLRDLMKGQVPRVLVVVNQARPEWVDPLRLVRAELAVFEVFCSDRNKYAYRFNGFAPAGPGQILSRCKLDRDLPWMLRIDSPAALNVRRNDWVSVAFGPVTTKWQRIDASDSVWLVPQSRVPLKRNREYELVRVEDGSFRLQESSRDTHAG
jgi:hypothetical protein